ncbi:hypothetical protein AY555_07680 [Haematospirillum jordaniae]|uniref:Uncharacterized protein n=1 Tax=Haematospirillum jordaniae TaxID=1549855 RepID=A0A143DEB9_9PROT|nr:hypothetical protein AY555_07680 [Haematospirillum jordaniae]
MAPRRHKSFCSSDDVGYQGTFHPRYLILEKKFPFLQANNLKLIALAIIAKSTYNFVKIAMLNPELGEAGQNLFPLFIINHRRQDTIKCWIDLILAENLWKGYGCFCAVYR